ncbi:transporter, major facilitator family [Lysobacter enzymogenes]|uniref:Transporter, major facilitator family n=1 Tax=Lysobacter enzymogenes TaxID=69 RepID=A0A0S2DFY3_LYSEN|nr:transporter, major facilitator family [Lysobacter enzymogenes]
MRGGARRDAASGTEGIGTEVPPTRVAVTFGAGEDAASGAEGVGTEVPPTRAAVAVDAGADETSAGVGTEDTAAQGLFAPRYRGLTAGAVALVSLVGFEALAVTTAMPTVARALDGLPLYALAFAGTLAASVVGMVAAGRWADARGPAAPLRHGIAWFALGLVVAGLAPAMGWLVAGRVIQGFGGGLISVALYVVVGRVYPPALRVKIFAAFAAAWVLPAIVGPAISGAIVEHFGWRWVFLAVPAVAALAACWVLPALRGLGPVAQAEPARRGDALRLPWALLATASLLALHYGGQQRGWGALAWLLPAAAALMLAASQLLPRGALRAARGLPTVVSLRGIAAGAYFLTEAYIPLLLSSERGLSPTWAGAVLTLGAIGWSSGSWLRGRDAQPRRPWRYLQAGMAMIALGVATIAAMALLRAPVALGIAGWIVAGLGMGLIYPTLSVLMLELSPPQEQGRNSSALHLGDAIYTAAALAAGGSLFAALLARSHTLAYVCGFAIALALALLGLALAARVRVAR